MIEVPSDFNREIEKERNLSRSNCMSRNSRNDKFARINSIRFLFMRLH